MLRVTNLSKSYGPRTLFDEVSFNLDRGERVGVVGRNGQGKTTLLRILLGQEHPDGGEISAPRGYRLGHLRQTLSFSAPTAVAEALRGLHHHRGEGEAEEGWKARKVLAGLGFTPAQMELPPDRLSGGFQVRLELAKTLLSEPDCLLLDEPTNFLDVVAVRWLERFLRGWKGELLLITHDRAFMDSVVTHVLGLHRGRARKMAGGTEKYYGQLASEEEVAEKARANFERKKKDTELFIRRFRAKARLAGMVQSRVKMLEKQEVPEEMEALPELEFSFRAAPFAAKTLLTAKELGFGFPGGDLLFSGLSFNLHPGDRLAVVGPNGRGKTTLLRLLTGELAPLEGEVGRHRALAVGYFGQTNVDRLNPARTVAEELLDSDPERSPQRARDVAGTMMFSGDDALKKVSVLSGGERARVLLGKLLLAPVHLLLLDEPTNHLDMESCESLLDALEGFAGAVVLVTHDERFLHRLAKRLVVFDGGRATLWEDGYQRFLSEVGWSAEKEEGGGEGGSAKDSRQERKVRAQRVQERSRALRPMIRRVEELEKAVAEAERELADNTAALVAASGRGDAHAIAECAKRDRELTSSRETLYADLFAATESLEEARKEWE